MPVLFIFLMVLGFELRPVVCCAGALLLVTPVILALVIFQLVSCFDAWVSLDCSPPMCVPE
jgi:hypothetical protein